MPDERLLESIVEVGGRGPQTPGEWLGVQRRKDPDLDMVLFEAEQARRGVEKFRVPARIRNQGDLQRFAQGARDWVWGNSVPTVGVSGWESGQPFGVALAQPKLVFEGASGPLNHDTVESLQRLFGLETRMRHLRQLDGYFEKTGAPLTYDILTGRDVTRSQLEAEMDDLETRVWPTRIIDTARAINGLETRARERKIAPGARVKDKEPFFMPSAALVQEMPAASAKSHRPGKGLVFAGGGIVLAGVLSACGSSATKPPEVVVGPTTWAEATATEEVETSVPDVTAEPTIAATATNVSTETPTDEPTATVQPTETVAPTEVPPQDLAREDGLDGFYRDDREYVIVEIDGVNYLRDEYNQALMLKNVGGEWVDTTLEEKYGHLAPKDADYEIRDVIKVPGGPAVGYTVPVYWTGNSRTEVITISDVGVETNAMRFTFVTRNANGEVVVVENFVGGFLGTANSTLIYLTENGHPVAEINGYQLDFEKMVSVLANHNISLVGTRVTFATYILSDQDKELATDTYSKMTCDINDQSYNGLARCNTVAWRQIRGDEYPLYAGFMDDGQALKDVLDAGTANQINMSERRFDFSIDRQLLGDVTVEQLLVEMQEN